MTISGDFEIVGETRGGFYHRRACGGYGFKKAGKFSLDNSAHAPKRSLAYIGSYSHHREGDDYVHLPQTPRVNLWCNFASVRAVVCPFIPCICPQSFTCLRGNPEHVVHGVVVTLFNHRRL